MADDTRYATLAARLLRDRAPSPDSRTSRDVGVSVIAEAITRRKRRRTTRLAFGVVATAFAAGAALFVAWPRARPTSVAVTAASRPLSQGESVVAPPGHSTSVVLASGTHITLDAGGLLDCREATATQRFGLLRGRARLQVAKLHAGQRFLVETANAEIEVKGTVFSVQIVEATPSCPLRTSVDVEDGVVAVSHAGVSLSLHAGEQWVSPCTVVKSSASVLAVAPASGSPTPPSPRRSSASTAARSVQEPAAHAAVAEPGSGAALAASASSAIPEPPAPPVSMLNEQNDLYARAQTATRAGRTDEALAAYQRLLALFPSGPLAEGASVQRVRLLARSDRNQAAVEASRYLARFPAGFARREMEALSNVP